MTETKNTETTTEQAIVKKKLGDIMVEAGDQGLALRTLDEYARFASTIARSGLAPKGMDTPEKVLVALQAGAECGLTPMRSLSSIAVINGRATIMGDAARAIIKRSGVLIEGTNVDLRIEGEGDKRVAVCQTTRKDEVDQQTTTFSVADAKKAGLWGRGGPWTNYPERMLKYRALGFHARDHFSDVLMGLYTTEETRDMPTVHSTVVDSGAPPEGDDPALEVD